jgi:hypothetical protein
MRRFVLLLSIVAAVLLSSAVMLWRPPAAAQDATPAGVDALATHPVVGVWDSSSSGPEGEPFPFIAIFHGDGTYQEIYPWGTIITGVWEPTGARTAEVTAINYEIVDERMARGEARFTAEVDATGDTIATDGTFVSRFEDGSIDVAAGGPSPGTRLGVLPVLPLAELTGTPAAGTPAP